MITKKNIAGVVLAAGFSLRMGTQKLLLPFGGKAVVAHIVDQLLGSKIGDVVVVVGRDEERIAGELAGRDVCFARNPKPDEGMLSSVRAGMAALPENCVAVMVALGDQPAITSGLIDEIIGFYEGNDKGISVPCFGGKRGHPLIFSARFREEVMREYDETGLRGLLEAHADEVAEMNVDDDGVLMDMDYPEDYRRELGRLAGECKNSG